MVNKLRLIYPHRLKKEFRSKFCVGSQVQHKTYEVGRMAYQLKRCAYNNEDQDESVNILRDKNYSKKYKGSVILKMYQRLVDFNRVSTHLQLF